MPGSNTLQSQLELATWQDKGRIRLTVYQSLNEILPNPMISRIDHEAVPLHNIRLLPRKQKIKVSEYMHSLLLRDIKPWVNVRPHIYCTGGQVKVMEACVTFPAPASRREVTHLMSFCETWHSVDSVDWKHRASKILEVIDCKIFERLQWIAPIGYLTFFKMQIA